MTVTVSWGGSQDSYKVVAEGGSASQLRESFEQAMKEIRPEPNKLQKALYGEAHLNSLPDATIRKIVRENRGMGNTMAHAMRQVAEAIQNPGKEIMLKRDGADNIAANRDYIEGHIKPIIDKLGLKFLVIYETRQTIKFDVQEF